jgi:hypothetical protein
LCKRRLMTAVHLAVVFAPPSVQLLGLLSLGWPVFVTAPVELTLSSTYLFLSNKYLK